MMRFSGCLRRGLFNRLKKFGHPKRKRFGCPVISLAQFNILGLHLPQYKIRIQFPADRLYLPRNREASGADTFGDDGSRHLFSHLDSSLEGIPGEYLEATASSGAELQLCIARKIKILEHNPGAVLDVGDEALAIFVGDIGDIRVYHTVGGVGHMAVGDIAGAGCGISAGGLQRAVVQAAAGAFRMGDGAPSG